MTIAALLDAIRRRFRVRWPAFGQQADHPSSAGLAISSKAMKSDPAIGHQRHRGPRFCNVRPAWTAQSSINGLRDACRGRDSFTRFGRTDKADDRQFGRSPLSMVDFPADSAAHSCPFRVANEFHRLFLPTVF